MKNIELTKKEIRNHLDWLKTVISHVDDQEKYEEIDAQIRIYEEALAET